MCTDVCGHVLLLLCDEDLGIFLVVRIRVTFFSTLFPCCPCHNNFRLLFLLFSQHIFSPLLYSYSDMSHFLLPSFLSSSSSLLLSSSSSLFSPNPFLFSFPLLSSLFSPLLLFSHRERSTEIIPRASSPIVCILDRRRG